MAYTRKQKKTLRWKETFERIGNGPSKYSREIDTIVRRVEHRKREQFRRNNES